MVRDGRAGRGRWRATVRSTSTGSTRQDAFSRDTGAVGRGWPTASRWPASVWRATANLLLLNYRVRSDGEDWTDVEEAVRLARSPCRFGGWRAYFVCPGVKNGRQCSRRVSKLYGGGRYFLCRHCYDLAYASQSEAPHDRLLRRANKRKIALGGTPGSYSLPPKPKGMHQRTYERHLAEIAAAEDQGDLAFSMGLRPRK